MRKRSALFRRAGVRRVSRAKPLHPIAGKPLLQHVWERCRRAKKLDHVIIATDDMRIAEAAFAWGAEVALTSANHRSGTDRIAEVAAKAKQFAHIINIQGDEPLIDPKLIDRLVRELQRDRKLEMITAAHPFADPRETRNHHIRSRSCSNRRGDALYFSRAPIPFACAMPTSHAQLFSPSGHLRLHRAISCSASSAGNHRRWSARNRSSNCARWRME